MTQCHCIDLSGSQRWPGDIAFAYRLRFIKVWLSAPYRSPVANRGHTVKPITHTALLLITALSCSSLWANAVSDTWRELTYSRFDNATAIPPGTYKKAVFLDTGSHSAPVVRVQGAQTRYGKDRAKEFTRSIAGPESFARNPVKLGIRLPVIDLATLNAGYSSPAWEVNTELKRLMPHYNVQTQQALADYAAANGVDLFVIEDEVRTTLLSLGTVTIGEYADKTDVLNMRTSFALHLSGNLIAVDPQSGEAIRACEFKASENLSRLAPSMKKKYKNAWRLSPLKDRDDGVSNYRGPSQEEIAAVQQFYKATLQQARQDCPFLQSLENNAAGAS